MEAILISSAGRRVGLVACFRESIALRGLRMRVLTIDSGSTAPATFLADNSWKVPRCTDAGFIDRVMQLCRQQRVGLIVPTIDTELPAYAAARERFAEIGTAVAVSGPETIRICGNKRETHEWLRNNDLPTVRQADLDAALRKPAEWPFPLIAKPCNGSASIGVRHIHHTTELELLAATGQAYIVQEIAVGREFTVNVYVDRAGKCVCAVPHWRMEIRGGEVSKGITVKDHRLMQMAAKLTERLPDAYGPLNIQCFLDGRGAISIIEMNARFGGGYPLAHQAGARFTDWLLDEVEGKVPPSLDSWTDSLAMLRYDQAVFVPGSRI